MWQGVGFSIGIKLSNFLLKTWNHLFCANTSNWNWLEKVTIVCLLLMSRNVSDISTSFWNKNEPEKKKLKRTTKGEKQQIHTTSDWTHQTQLLSMQLLPIRNIWNPLMAPEKKRAYWHHATPTDRRRVGWVRILWGRGRVRGGQSDRSHFRNAHTRRWVGSNHVDVFRKGPRKEVEETSIFVWYFDIQSIIGIEASQGEEEEVFARRGAARPLKARNT